MFTLCDFIDIILKVIILLVVLVNNFIALQFLIRRRDKKVANFTNQHL